MKKTLLLIALGLAAGLFIAAGIAISQPHRLSGSVIDPPQPAPEIALGNFTLSANRGKTALIFFGYTSCPDVCPATLGEMKEILNRLGDKAGGVAMIFITVDPKRDTPEKMSTYTAAFDPRIHGLTGSLEQLNQVWQAYGVYRAEQPTGNEGLYTVDHSSRAYLIDPQGNLRTTYTFGTPTDDILADIKSLMSSK
jgi:protein SCO1/2